MRQEKCKLQNFAINNLQSNLLKQDWTSFFNLSGAISQHVEHHFLNHSVAIL